MLPCEGTLMLKQDSTRQLLFHVYLREREREGGRERGREREGGREREREGGWEREGGRER